MSTNDTDFDELIKRLSQVPELEPSPDIVDNIMTRIKPVRTPFWRKLFNHLTMPCQILLRPLPLVLSTALLAAVFWLGLLTGLHKGSADGQIARSSTTENAMLEAESSFLAGQHLMAAGLSAEALPLLQKASLSVPENPEYAYWEGLCYWANGMPEKERSSYTRGISTSPDRVPILLNLGHNFLEQRELSAALGQYNKVLTIAPRQQAALYNRGLIYHLLQDFQNEMTAWKTYLQFYRNGKNSFRAVERLNNLNDFTYRTYQLGGRKIILSQAALLDMRSAEEKNNELRKLTDALGKDPSLSLDIVLFYEHDALEAQKNAVLLKKKILAELGEKEQERVRLSWFGKSETVQTSIGSSRLTESLLLFGSRNFTGRKETEI